jgi:cytochrome c-type biogenesis protein CcmH
MGLVWLGLIALVTVGLLWVMSLRGPVLTLAAAAIVFGCAGYAFQGRPGLAGSDRVATQRAAPMSLAETRHALTGQFDYSDSWLNMADALASRGRTEDAARLLQTQANRRPGDFKLWIGLGNALADHSQTLTPAARLAFENAAKTAPGHPAPLFFLGLAEARSGNPERAILLWRAILDTAPADASWRPVIENGIIALQAGGVTAPPAAPAPQAGS